MSVNADIKFQLHICPFDRVAALNYCKTNLMFVCISVLSLMSTARARLQYIFKPTALFEDLRQRVGTGDSNVRNHAFVKILLVRTSLDQFHMYALSYHFLAPVV